MKPPGRRGVLTRGIDRRKPQPRVGPSRSGLSMGKRPAPLKASKTNKRHTEDVS